jgi:hypothetical protein
MKHHGFKNLSMTKQNKKKQSTLDIQDYLLLFLKNWQPETLIFHISEIVFGELAKRTTAWNPSKHVSSRLVTI